MYLQLNSMSQRGVPCCDKPLFRPSLISLNEDKRSLAVALSHFCIMYLVSFLLQSKFISKKDSDMTIKLFEQSAGSVSEEKHLHFMSDEVITAGIKKTDNYNRIDLRSSIERDWQHATYTIKWHIYPWRRRARHCPSNQDYTFTLASQTWIMCIYKTENSFFCNLTKINWYKLFFSKLISL